MSEMLGTLFKYIFALMGVGVVVALGYTVMSTNKAAAAVSEIGTIVTNTQTLYANQLTYTGLGNNTLITAGAIPSTYVANAPTINTPWNGSTITLAVDAANPEAFDLTVAGVPGDDCVKLVTSLTGFSSVNFNGAKANTAAPVAPDVVAAGCNLATNSILFVYNPN